jgi:hypothetical protein
MNYYLIDFNEDTNYTFDNVIIGKKITINNNDNISKYYIYYFENNINISPQIIYIKIPKIRLIYKIGQSKYNQEKILLYPIYDKLQLFINFIKNFEEDISLCIKKKFPDLELSSILSKNISNNYLLKININNNIKITSEINNIKITDFKINNEIECIIQINNIWIKNNNFGINCEFYQIKYHPSIHELNKDLFNNTTEIIPPPINQIIQPTITTSIIQPISQPIIQPQINKLLIPSVDALLSAKSKLKPTIIN